MKFETDYEIELDEFGDLSQWSRGEQSCYYASDVPPTIPTSSHQ